MQCSAALLLPGARRRQDTLRTDRPRTGETVVLVPGASLPLRVWDPVMEPLRRLGYRVLRFDLVGRGGGTSLNVKSGLESDIAQIEALLGELQLREPVHMVGLASGAISVAAFALAQPQRVASNSLIAPDGWQTLSLREKIFLAPIMGEMLITTHVAQRLLLKRVRRYSDVPEIQKFLHQLMLGALIQPGYMRAVLDYVRAFPLNEGHAYYKQLARSGHAVRVLLGADDHINRIEDLHDLIQSFGPAAVDVMVGIGHLPHVEAPDVVAESLHKHFAKAVLSVAAKPEVASHAE